MNRFFVTGIGTDVGKTVVAAILAEALQADYWKPVQAGELEMTDTMKVRQLVSNPKSVFHTERYLLKTPASPHHAANLDGLTLDIHDFELPETHNALIIEGAGGLLVPLNQRHLVSDLIVHLESPAVIVSQNYLGSINHTLLTIEYMRYRNIAIAGVVFNGEPNPAGEEAILHFGNVKVLGRVGHEEAITPEVVSRYAVQFRPELLKIVEKNEFV